MMSSRNIAAIDSSRWMLGVCAVLLAACSSDKEASMMEPQQEPDNSVMQVITGEVWYRERMALPPGEPVRIMVSKQGRN